MQTKNKFKKKFFCLLLFEGTLTSFFKDKNSKRSHKAVGIKVFSYYFCLVIEGSGAGSGPIPLTNGSGSGSRRPKNIRSDGSGSATLIAGRVQPSKTGGY
jgi:hypothetical protein